MSSEPVAGAPVVRREIGFADVWMVRSSLTSRSVDIDVDVGDDAAESRVVFVAGPSDDASGRAYRTNVDPSIRSIE